MPNGENEQFNLPLGRSAEEIAEERRDKEALRNILEGLLRGDYSEYNDYSKYRQGDIIPYQIAHDSYKIWDSEYARQHYTVEQTTPKHRGLLIEIVQFLKSKGFECNSEFEEVISGRKDRKMDTKLKKYLSREQPRARQQEKTQEDDEQPEVKRDPWGIGRSLSDTDLED